MNGIPPEDAAVRVTEGAFFHLQPQHEGTFYCGEMDGEKRTFDSSYIAEMFIVASLYPVIPLLKLFLMHLCTQTLSL